MAHPIKAIPKLFSLPCYAHNTRKVEHKIELCRWFKNGLKAQKLLAQGIALGTLGVSIAPCKGKSFKKSSTYNMFPTSDTRNRILATPRFTGALELNIEYQSSYTLAEFGVTSVNRFNKELDDIKHRLMLHPLSSPREPMLKRFHRPYHSAIIKENWKIIYRYDEANDLVIFVDLWDMRRSPRYLIRQFKRKL